MKTILSALAVLAALAFLPAAGAQPKITTAASSAKAPLLIPYRPGGIRIDGQGTDEVWKQIPPLTSFRYYWDPEEPPRTELRLFHDDENLYFLYTVEDPDILRHPVIGEEMEIASEDRIEFGFSPEDPAVPYYFFEIDSAGRVLDYESRFYRQFDPEWDSLSLEVIGRTTENGYEVEGKFSLAELRDLGVLRPDGKMLLGCFRGEYENGKDPEENHKWISWVYPQTAQPDFHIHSAFGTAQLETP